MMNRSAASAFVPSTVAAVERGAAAIVARFSGPVRAIGSRALGFADRIISSRIGAFSDGTGSPRRSVGPGSWTLPVPWYDLDDEGERATPARATSTRSAPRPEGIRDSQPDITARPALAGRAAELSRSALDEVASSPILGNSLRASAAPRASSIARAPFVVPAVPSTDALQAPANVGPERLEARPAAPQSNGAPAHATSSAVADPVPADRVLALETSQTVAPEVRAADVVHRIGRDLPPSPMGISPALMPRPATSAASPGTPTALGRPLSHGAWVDRQVLGRTLVTTADSVELAVSAIAARQAEAVSYPMVSLIPEPEAVGRGGAGSIGAASLWQQPASPLLEPASSLNVAPLRELPLISATSPIQVFPSESRRAPALPSQTPEVTSLPALFDDGPVIMTEGRPLAASAPPSVLAPDSSAPSVTAAEAPSLSTASTTRSPRREQFVPTRETGFEGPGLAAGMADVADRRHAARTGEASPAHQAFEGWAFAAPTPPSARDFGASIAAGAGSLLRFLDRLTGTATAYDARVLPIDAGRSFEFVRVEERAASAPRSGAPSLGYEPPGLRAMQPDPLRRTSEQHLAPRSTPPRGVFGSPAPTSALADLAVAPHGGQAQSAGFTHFQLAPPLHDAAAASVHLRPGGVAARAEQLAGGVGIRAAGLSVDFIDPEQSPWLARARASLEQTLLGPHATDDRRTDRIRGDGARSPVLRSATSSAAHDTDTPPGSHSHPSSPMTSSMGLDAASAADPSARALTSSLSRTLHEVWALSTVFPAAGPSALTAAKGGDEITARHASTNGHPGSRAETQPTSSSTSLTAIGRSAGVQTERRLPDLPRPQIALSASATDRTSLPDGRLPRGSFTWSRAAAFADQISEWTPPASVIAATAGGEAAANGLSVWSGMSPMTIPLVRDAFAEPGSESARGDDAGSATPPVGRFDASGLRFVAPSSSPHPAADTAGRNLAGRATAPRSSVEAQPPQHQLSHAEVASYLRVVASGGHGSPSGTSSAGAGSFIPSGRSGESRPLVAASSSSQSSSSIVEALRTQQQAPSDDRITLADLTLVAAASATQQMAAAGDSPTGAAPRSGGSGGGESNHQQAKGGEARTPEADQREIEEMARALVDELKSQITVALERSGRSWE